LTTIVLAGGPRDAVAALEPGAPNKAFVRIAGKTLVERAIDGLRSAQSVGTIIAVAPPCSASDPALRSADAVRGDGERIADSLARGLEGLPPDELVLVCPSDVPLLSGVGIDEFVSAARHSEAAIVYAALERRIHLARFPGVPHTWARLRDGTYCGGGLIAIRPGAFGSLVRFLDRLSAARKSPAKLAALMGLDVIARYLTGRLSIADCETRASALLNVAVRAALISHPEIAVNVDRPSDVALVEKLLDG
jgi:molybdopterin-guanine dinucleotide biosynthesis protein A